MSNIRKRATALFVATALSSGALMGVTSAADAAILKVAPSSTVKADNGSTKLTASDKANARADVVKQRAILRSGAILKNSSARAIL